MKLTKIFTELKKLFTKKVDIKNLNLENSKITGYKVTDSNMKCRGFQFEIGKKFKIEGEVKICKNGFHFCEKTVDCFNYYPFTSLNRVFLVEGSGVILSEGDKMCSEEIEFMRELSWHEVLDLVNTGNNNTGFGNSGDKNSGNHNSGNYNSGNRNSGNENFHKS